MERWRNKIAVVTGASSGIGAAIVKDLARAGIKTVGIARRVKLVEDLKLGFEEFGENIYPYQCDVSNEMQIREAFKWIYDKFNGVNILINNAGISVPRLLLSDIDTNEDINSTVATNILGVVYCIRETYKILKKTHEFGVIINMNSVLGHSIPRTIGSKPEYNIYPATKHAVTAITETIRQEINYLKLRNIRITNINPGIVDTAMTNNLNYFGMIQHLDPRNISNAVLYILGLPLNVNIKDITIQPVGDIF